MQIRAIFMGVAFAFMWASAFSSARMIVADAPPLAALAVRFLLSGLLGIAIARALGQTWRLNALQWRAVVIFGICQNTIYLGFNFVAMQTIEAGLATIVAATMPLLVGFAGWAFLKQRIPLLGTIGLIGGFIGVTVIMGSRLTQGVDLFGLMLCVIGVISLTIATMTVKQAASGGNILMIVGLQMLVSSASLAAMSWFSAETLNVTWTTTLGLAFVYTTLVPGLLATWVWFLLVEQIGAVRAATFHFLTPPFGVGVAAILLGEHIGWLDALGVLIVAFGILAVQISKRT